MFTYIKSLFGIHPEVKPPTALMLAVAELENTQREILREASLAEEHTGNVAILEGRQLRLRKAIVTLSRESSEFNPEVGFSPIPVPSNVPNSKISVV